MIVLAKCEVNGMVYRHFFFNDYPQACFVYCLTYLVVALREVL